MRVDSGNDKRLLNVRHSLTDVKAAKGKEKRGRKKVSSCEKHPQSLRFWVQDLRLRVKDERRRAVFIY
jgi:hypothetical protein